jgi:hypothetical protein
MKNLKERYKRTVERKLENGDDIIFDEEKGIINDETGEVVIDIKIIRGDFGNLTIDKDDDESDEKEGSLDNGQGKSDKKEEAINSKNIVENETKKIDGKFEEEVIDTFKGHNEDDLSEQGENEDDSDHEENELNK